MNEKLQYASMLEIPVNTCNITYKPIKKKKRKKNRVSSEEVKQELLAKVNSSTQTDEVYLPAPTENVQADIPYERRDSVVMHNDAETVRAKSKNTKSSPAVTIQLIIVGVLLAVIFLTTAFYPNSGIGAFLNGTFTNEQAPTATVDDRNYSDFTPVFSFGSEGAVISDGVTTITATGSVYAPCDGTVTTVSADGNGKFSLEITHSENFKSVLTGLDYAYAEKGDEVFGNIPVGFIREGELKMCFTGENGEIITDYQLSGNTVVWAV